MSRFRRLVVTLILLAALAAASPAWAAKDELVIGITQFPSTFHPAMDSMMAKSYIQAMARRPVTVHDKAWKVVCLLCTELPTIENGLAVPEDLPDGRKGIRVTYSLQPQARWGDGTPLTTADVVFSWQVGKHPRSGLSNVELYRRITAIDVKDDKTFTLHVDRLTFDYNAINDLEILPAHLERKVFEAEPAAYRNRTLFDAEPTNPGLYFGPYRITQVSRGAFVVLEPNPTWYGPKPAFKRIVVKTIENSAALEANLLSGSVDYVAGELGLSLDQALAFEKRHHQRYDVLYKPGLVYEHIEPNLALPALADRRVRRALLMGIDREAMVAQLFGGRQPVAVTGVSPLDWVFAKDLKPVPYDPKAAGQLLDEAGWPLGEGKIRRNAKGEGLAVDLMTTAGNRARELVQQVVQSQWKRLGIDVRIRNEPARVFFGETVTHRNFQGLALFAWISSPENVPRTTLHSEGIPTADNNWAGQNYTGYSNPEMDALLERIELELDRDRRAALWRRFQEIYLADLPALPLFFRADAYILPKWLKGIEPTGHQYATTLWVEHWRAE